MVRETVANAGSVSLVPLLLAPQPWKQTSRTYRFRPTVRTESHDTLQNCFVRRSHDRISTNRSHL